MTWQSCLASFELAGMIPCHNREDPMTKLDAALLKLEGALDYTVDPPSDR